jgi:hypothetical protein
VKTTFGMTAIAAALIASSASAQRNFELDDLATAVTETGSTFYGSSWVSNPNVRRSTTNGSCYYVPGRLNTAAGDTILSAKHDSIIYMLLSSLGQSHSHTGMARSSQSIRHNNMVQGEVDLVEAGNIPQYLKPTGTNSLREGAPGTITHTVEAGVTAKEFNFLDGIVLWSSYTNLAESTRRTAERTAALDEMDAFRGYYRLYAYTDMTWDDPYTRSSNDGNMCSGSIFYAHYNAGNTGWSWSSRRSYPASTRQPAAKLLYDKTREAILDEPSFFESVVFNVNWILGGTNVVEFADRAANQVVNCMAFNDCGNRTSRWRDGVGSGASLSPDDLYTLALSNALNAALSGTTNQFVYNAAKPVESTGDYYCCVKDTTNNVGGLLGPLPIPTFSTKCSRQF